jgi:hypothetical protein
MDRTFAPERPSIRTATPPRPSTTRSAPARRKLTAGRRLRRLAVLDVMAVAWMVTAGGWFDRHGMLTVATLGGHPQIVAALATVSLLLLAGLAVSTQGFDRATAAERVLLVVAGVLTVAALAGLFAIVGLVLLVATFVGLLVKLSRP